MTSLTWPRDLLTLAEWEALSEDEAYRHAELVEGVLQMSPRPTSSHQLAGTFLTEQLNRQLRSRDLVAVIEVEVLVNESSTPTIRVPDIAVTGLATARSRAKRWTAADLALVVEIVSPGSRRVDRIMKLADYADAGIPNYWIVDIDRTPTLDVFHLVDGTYTQIAVAATGTVTLTEPAPLTIDLPALVP